MMCAPVWPPLVRSHHVEHRNYIWRCLQTIWRYDRRAASAGNALRTRWQQRRPGGDPVTKGVAAGGGASCTARRAAASRGQYGVYPLYCLLLARAVAACGQHDAETLLLSAAWGPLSRASPPPTPRTPPTPAPRRHAPAPAGHAAAPAAARRRAAAAASHAEGAVRPAAARPAAAACHEAARCAGREERQRLKWCSDAEQTAASLYPAAPDSRRLTPHLTCSPPHPHLPTTYLRRRAP